jgi:hypothetical protein
VITPIVFADTDWSTVVTAAVAAFLTVATTIGGGIGWLLNWRSKQEDKERKYSTEMMTRFEALVGKVESISTEFRTANRDMAKDFQGTATSLAKEARTESREVMKTLLNIQSEAVEAVGGLATEVRALGMALNELRLELDRKQDKHPSLVLPAGVTGGS